MAERAPQTEEEIRQFIEGVLRDADVAYPGREPVPYEEARQIYNDVIAAAVSDGTLPAWDVINGAEMDVP